MRSNLELFGHIGDNIGLGDGLAAGNRKRPIGIGAGFKIRIDKFLARCIGNRVQDTLVANAFGT